MEILIDRNCDLGEGENPARTRALLGLVTSANIACGGHAGTEVSLRRTLALCRALGVRAGAHPGFFDRAHFGRRVQPITASELTLLLLHQAGAFAQAAAAEGVSPHHLKLHGALYHVVENDRRLALACVEVMARYFPGWKLYALASGLIAAAAQRKGVEVWREVFADRAYQASGQLVPRDRPGAMLTSPVAVRRRLADWKEGRGWLTEAGTRIALEAETVCVHADTPRAIALARAASAALGGPERRASSPSAHSQRSVPRSAPKS